MGINRGTVLDLINDVHRAGGFKDYNSYSYIFDQVDTMPESKEDAEPHWILCSERPPEVSGCYLVSVKNDHERRYSKTAWFEKGVWFARQDVIAWMPLPEPYKGVTE